jgi:D-sedoheptulose 7-phosphate isomerase
VATFPNHYYHAFEDFMVEYAFEHRKALSTINVDAVAEAAKLIEGRIKHNQTIFVCGNGGSAAIANHLECDFAKGIPTRTTPLVYLKPIVVSLCRLELITAYANDYCYEDTFWRQLEQAARPGDMLIALSASGTSPNVVKAVRNFSQGPRVAMTGFNGGTVANLSTVNIHVDSHNYGICEDIFQTVMHMIAQYVRQANMDSQEIGNARF